MNLRPSEPHSIRGWQTACKHPGNNGDLREPLTRPLPGNHRPGQGLSTLASTQAGRLEAPALPASSPANRGNGLLAAAPSHRTANWASDTSRRLPGAATAASPRRSAPEAILEQCLDSGRAGTEHGGKEGPQPGVEVQFTARQCVPTALDGSQVIKQRLRLKNTPRNRRVGRCSAIRSPWMAPGSSEASALANPCTTCRFRRQDRIWRSATSSISASIDRTGNSESPFRSRNRPVPP